MVRGDNRAVRMRKTMQQRAPVSEDLLIRAMGVSTDEVLVQDLMGRD